MNAIQKTLHTFDKKKLGHLLQELGEACSYQMADKRGEWGIEDALVDDLGMPEPNDAETEEEEEAQMDALQETAYEVIDEFDRVVAAGLLALGYELKPKEEE